MVVDARTATAAHVRLGPADSQRIFRQLLDAFARPGTFSDLSDIASAHDVEPVLLPALALADLGLRVALIDADRADGLGEVLRRSTGAVIVDDLARAEFVVAADPPTPDDIGHLERGSSLAPELGARLVIACERLAVDGSPNHGVDGVDLVLSGPGARDGRLITVGGVDREVFAALQSANADHPAGIDTWLVDTAGLVVGIPRSSNIHAGSAIHEGRG